MNEWVAEDWLMIALSWGSVSGHSYYLIGETEGDDGFVCDCVSFWLRFLVSVSHTAEVGGTEERGGSIGKLPARCILVRHVEGDDGDRWMKMLTMWEEEKIGSCWWIMMLNRYSRIAICPPPGIDAALRSTEVGTKSPAPAKVYLTGVPYTAHTVLK